MQLSRVLVGTFVLWAALQSVVWADSAQRPSAIELDVLRETVLQQARQAQQEVAGTGRGLGALRRAKVQRNRMFRKAMRSAQGTKVALRRAQRAVHLHTQRTAARRARQAPELASKPRRRRPSGDQQGLDAQLRRAANAYDMVQRSFAQYASYQQAVVEAEQALASQVDGAQRTLLSATMGLKMLQGLVKDGQSLVRVQQAVRHAERAVERAARAVRRMQRLAPEDEGDGLAARIAGEHRALRAMLDASEVLRVAVGQTGGRETAGGGG